MYELVCKSAKLRCTHTYESTLKLIHGETSTVAEVLLDEAASLQNAKKCQSQGLLTDRRAVHRHISPNIAKTFLLLLCTSSGMFTSATSLLPSSFTMYTLTLSAAAVLNSDHRRVVLYAMVGVIWGWAVAGVAFLPYALLLLLVGAPIVYLPAGVVFLVGTVAPMVAFDRLFYGKWTVSFVARLQQPGSYLLAINTLLHCLYTMCKWHAAFELHAAVQFLSSQSISTTKVAL